MMLLSHLSPETITEISLEDEEEEEESEDVCFSRRCQTTISGRRCFQFHAFSVDVCCIFTSKLALRNSSTMCSFVLDVGGFRRPEFDSTVPACITTCYQTLIIADIVNSCVNEVS